MTNAAFAGFELVTTSMIWLATLRRNRLRPWLPTYAAVALNAPPRSCWTDAVYWYTFSGIAYSFA